MQFNEIYERTKYAFENNEVKDLLEGKNGYMYQAPRYPVSIPTCIEYIFDNGIYPLYKNTRNEVILDNLSNAIEEMINSDNPITLWWVTSILYLMKINESDDDYKNNTPFRLTDKYWEQLSARLILKKTDLSIETKFGGSAYSNGLWGDIERINGLLIKYFHIYLLKGEDNEI